MSNVIKIKLKSGIREIEIEAARSDVDELLATWWNNPDAQDKFQPRELRKNEPQSNSAFPDFQGSEAPFDANEVVNHIKQREDFSEIERKIIHANGEQYQKVALVLWVVDAPLTSGQIHRTLEALGIRISLPNISTALKRNIGKFLTSAQRKAGGTPASYRLTAQAKAEFEKWFSGNAS